MEKAVLLIVTSLLVLTSVCLSAQTSLPAGSKKIIGQIVDAETNKSLPYVNIGVIGKNVGTVSWIDGSFHLQIPTNLDSEELKISMVGYEAMIFKVSEIRRILRTKPKIYLKPAIIDLKEVVVMPKFRKTKVLGNTTTSTKMTDGFYGDALGREGGAIIKLKKKFRPARVLKLRASIARNDYDTIKFRINFYDLKDGLPGEKIVQKNILVSSTIKQGILEVDLEPYEITLNEDFCVTLEWIEDFGNKRLLFSMGFLGAKTVYRYTSQGSWEKYNFVGPGFNVTIGY